MHTESTTMIIIGRKKYRNDFFYCPGVRVRTIDDDYNNIVLECLLRINYVELYSSPKAG
jgi:hypothetical protein